MRHRRKFKAIMSTQEEKYSLRNVTIVMLLMQIVGHKNLYIFCYIFEVNKFLNMLYAIESCSRLLSDHQIYTLCLMPINRPYSAKKHDAEPTSKYQIMAKKTQKYHELTNLHLRSLPYCMFHSCRDSIYASTRCCDDILP